MLSILKRKSLRPERAPSFLWQIALTIGFYALLIYGGSLADHGVTYPMARRFGPAFCLSASVLLIVGAFLIKRWQRKPPTRTTAKVEESPAELASWASSVLDKKLK